MPQTLSISRLARAAGVGIDTVRYYERNGLLPEPPRRASGYRDYPLASVQRLRFIRRAKELGFSLDEVRELLELSTRNELGVAGVKAAAAAKLALVEERLAELQRLRDGLRRLIDRCPGHGSADECPILQVLAGEQAATDQPSAVSGQLKPRFKLSADR